VLQKNVALNGYTNVELVQSAVADVSGCLTLHRSRANSGDHRLFAADDQRPTIDVNAVALDDLF
jgi:FkbM family methyltransferase